MLGLYNVKGDGTTFVLEMEDRYRAAKDNNESEMKRAGAMHLLV
jgi:hypothetical protein